MVSFDASRSSLLIVSVEDGLQTRVPIDGSDQVWLPDFSPDGLIVASVVVDDAGRLVVMDSDGSDQMAVYDGDGVFHHAE